MKFLSLFVFILSFNSFACSCMQWTDAAAMLKDADSVVLAVPVEESTLYSEGEYASILKTGMKVVKHYKGKYKKFFYLLSEEGDGANCGLKFNKYDGLFLIFSYKHNSEFYITNMCSTGYVTPDNEEVHNILNQLDKL